MSADDPNPLPGTRHPDEVPTLDPGVSPPPTRPEALRPDGAAAPKTLGPYEVVSEIGRGGMGVVYKAFHPGLKRTVALKVLIAGEDASEESIARFHREAESVAKLGHHPNIVPVFDIGTQGRVHYFAMHFVEGKSLDRMIDDGEVGPKRAATFARKIASALQHAHDRGVMHRDVKPANILVTAAGEPQLTDFGLAKDVASESRMTRTGVSLGTPNYMPPEQADGRTDDIGERSDVYSLGATLYEMLTLQPPFEGATVAELVHKVLFKDPVPPRRINPGLDRDLETICLKCLEKDPGRRYASAAEVAEDLERSIGGRPILARPASLFEKLAKRARRNVAFTAALAALAVLVLAGAGAGALGLHRLATHRARQAEAEENEERERQAREEAERGRGEETALRMEEEARRKEAQAREQEYAVLLEKNRLVSRVMLGAFARLGALQEELRKDYAEQRGERNVAPPEVWRDVEEFAASFPEDPTSRSTVMAVQGWLSWHGGRDREGLRLLADAQELDPEVPWGHLFEAFIWLGKIIEGQQIPNTLTSGLGVTFSPMPPESAGLRKAREIFESKVARAAAARLWGEHMGEEFRGLVTGLEAANRGAFAEAEAGLNDALRLTELSWIRIELLFLRVKARYFQKKFPECEEDLDILLRLVPGNPWVHYYRGKARLARGAMVAAQGTDARDLFRGAVEAYEAALALRDHPMGLITDLGIAHQTLGMAEAQAGGDPAPAFEKAFAAYSSDLRNMPGDFSDLVNRGSLQSTWGDTVMLRGGDPTERFDAALEDFDKALRIRPGDPVALGHRARLTMNRSRYKGMNGQDRRPDLRAAVQDYTEALKADPADPIGLVNRAIARSRLASALSGYVEEDPMPDFRSAVSDLEEALRLAPDYIEAHNSLGLVYLEWGNVLEKFGEPPPYDRSEAAFQEALRRNPDSWQAQVNLASLREAQGRYDEAVKVYMKALAAGAAGVQSVRWNLMRASGVTRHKGWERDLAVAQRRAWAGNFPAARELFHEALAAAGEDGAFDRPSKAATFASAHYNLACIEAQAAAGKKAPRARIEPVDPEVAAEFRQKALEHLEKAVEFGYAKFDHVTRDPDLDPIRQEPAFQALMEFWARKLGREGD